MQNFGELKLLSVPVFNRYNLILFIRREMGGQIVDFLDYKSKSQRFLRIVNSLHSRLLLQNRNVFKEIEALNSVITDRLVFLTYNSRIESSNFEYHSWPGLKQNEANEVVQPQHLEYFTPINRKPSGYTFYQNSIESMDQPRLIHPIQQFTERSQKEFSRNFHQKEEWSHTIPFKKF